MTRMDRRRRMLKNKRMLLLRLAVIIFLAGLFVQRYPAEEAVPVGAMQAGSALHGGWRDILRQGIPGMQANGETGKAHTPGTLIDEGIRFFANVDGKDARSILRAEIPVLALVKSAPEKQSANKTELPKLELKKGIPQGQPLVGIYHTHTAESFIPSTGVAHRPGGTVGEITEVGEALVEALAKRDIAAIQSKDVNDYPSFMKAYGKSEETAAKMLKEYPSLQMIFDIHRDADKRENVITTIQGEEVARIMIIVAQGQEDLPQPHWKENYAFAKLIEARLNAKYPGLLKEIQLVDWRYNQHLHPHALLLEIGSEETSTEEAVKAINYFGDVLADLIKEGQGG